MQRKCQKIIVGLTGGIASGKTTVLNEFKKLGFQTASADEISREVFNRPPVQRKIRKIFSTTDRKKIAEIIFSNKKKRKQLEKIIHPPVIKEIKKLSEQLAPFSVLVVEVPLLFEKNLKKLFNIIVVVWASKQTQIARLKKIGLSRSDALKRISSQMPLSDKKRLADRIIYNIRGLNYLKMQVKKLADECHLLLEQKGKSNL